MEVSPLLSKKNTESRHWDEYWETMPKERLRAWQFKKIQQLIKYAYENVPFYRKLYDDAGIKPRDIVTWEDFWYKVPMFDKPQLLQDQEAAEHKFALTGILPMEHANYLQMTTGTTGKPIRILRSHLDTMIGDDGTIQGLWWAGIRPEDSVYFCFNFGPFAAFWTAFYAFLRLGVTIMSGAGLSTEDRIRQVIDLNPTIIAATPTYLLRMLDTAEKMGIDLSQSAIKYSYTGGETGAFVPGIRKRVMEGFGLKGWADAYGLSESYTAAYYCGFSPGVHVVEKSLYSYCIDPETKEKLTGEGKIGEAIVTNLNQIMQPYIKYRTHDLVERYEYPDHGCGITWDFLKNSVLGRTDYMITLRGVNIYQSAIEGLLGKSDQLSMRYEMHLSKERGLDRMLVRVEANKGVAEEHYGGLARGLNEVYKYNLKVDIPVEVLPPDTLPKYELKTRRVFDHRLKQ